MKLNHLDLFVHDVPATLAWFQRWFGLTLRTKPDAPTFGILTDGHGFVLVVQRAAEGERYPDGFHLGFLVPDEAEVRALQARARAEGVAVSDVLDEPRGTLTYFTAPDGYRVEVSCQRAGYERQGSEGHRS